VRFIRTNKKEYYGYQQEDYCFNDQGIYGSTTDLVIALTFLLRTVVLGFLGQLDAASSSDEPLRLKDSTPHVLPFNLSARVARSSELESDNVLITLGSMLGR
jgi:hypothetical protein